MYEAQRSALASRAQQQREWAVQGIKKVKSSGERDKFIRHFRTQSSERLAGKARATDRALERLEENAVEKPWVGWELRMDVATAPRSGDVVARLEDAVVRRGDVRSGADRPRDRATGSASPSSARTAAGRRPCCKRCSASCHSSRAHSASARRSSSAGSSRRATASPATGTSSPRSRARAAPTRPRAGRRSRSSGSVPSTYCGPRTPSRRASGPEPCSHCSPSRASTASCSTNRRTISTCPRSSNSSRRLDTFTGTMLLVTHDRGTLVRGHDHA